MSFRSGHDENTAAGALVGRGYTDPVYRQSRREAVVILAVWVVFCAWVVGYCGLFGYGVDEESLTLVLGMPSWVFWGVGVPWVAANIVTIWFSLRFMRDQPLGEDEDG